MVPEQAVPGLRYNWLPSEEKLGRAIERLEDQVRDCHANRLALLALGDRLARAVEERWSGPGGCDCECCSAAKAWRAATGESA